MLIHKTMKMPASCLSCWIAPTCEVWVREKSKYKGYDDRLDECPLEEVVRCKDCTYCNNGWCYDFGIRMNDNEFCSGGERKDKTDLKEIK